MADPMDKSIPPINNTKVMPTDATPTIETWRIIVNILLTVRKFLLERLKKMNTANSTKYIAYFLSNVPIKIRPFLAPCRRRIPSLTPFPMPRRL